MEVDLTKILYTGPAGREDEEAKQMFKGALKL